MCKEAIGKVEQETAQQWRERRESGHDGPSGYGGHGGMADLMVN